MCRMEGDRIYLCDKARSGKPCHDIRRVPTSYIHQHQRGSASRDDTPSPVNPPTPTSSGTYLTQHRRPSSSGSRPSTRDGKRISSELIIEIGPKKGKSNGKKYPSLSISTKAHKRTSFGSIASNDAAVDSGESEASYTLRTGFPEAPLPPTSAFDPPNTFLPTPLPTQRYYHRHTPSASSSQTPSLTVPSDTDFDPSATRRSTRPSATIIHHSTPDPASPTWPQRGLSTGSYKTERIVPRNLPQVSQTSTSSHPLDYDQYADHSGSSRASSGIAEASRPTKNSGKQRKKPSGDSVFEDVSRRLAEDVEKSENDKHVRFELGRYAQREKERAERILAEKENDRAAIREAERERKRLERLEQEKKEREDRERERRRLEHLEQEKKEREDRERERRRLERLEQERKDREEQKAKDRKKERSKPPTTDTTKRPSSSRRMSSLMTPQEQAEQKRLLEVESLFMQNEKQAAEAREREERRAARQQQQQQQESSAYYDPRGGDRSLSSANNASRPRRDSAASITRPSGLANTPSGRRPTISQPNPPTVSVQPPTDYSTRPTMSRGHAPPPVSFPKNFNQDYARPPSARRPSLTKDNPFSVASPTADPWDLRTVDAALPSARTSDSRKHQTAYRAPQYVSAFDDDDIGFDDFPSFASRTGLSRSGSKRKH